MISITAAISCDFCGANIRVDSQRVPASDVPMVALNAPTIFGKHTCDDCLAVAKAAIKAALPEKVPTEARLLS